ncbi:hypothetical protein AJ78_00790 [Emergomyces pasteurianus Ep9510]|uniref:Uncharacterized protein n=1 Tax=Emergomyces pasteurianus Ep9510 TaxID=1447872 RepID=A0A1J9QTR4_9EURO|nr:hypothetical protein AJ78_00790 [Emergomyces pasteurianus Ep9510]
MMNINNVHPRHVVFHQELHRNDYAAIFFVSVQRFDCGMKVHHDHRGHGSINEPETTAYRRLQSYDAPQFCGSIEKLEPELWQPNLNVFINDTELPKCDIY